MDQAEGKDNLLCRCEVSLFYYCRNRTVNKRALGAMTFQRGGKRPIAYGYPTGKCPRKVDGCPFVVNWEEELARLGIKPPAKTPPPASPDTAGATSL